MIPNVIKYIEQYRKLNDKQAEFVINVLKLGKFDLHRKIYKFLKLGVIALLGYNAYKYNIDGNTVMAWLNGLAAFGGLFGTAATIVSIATVIACRADLTQEFKKELEEAKSAVL